MQSVTAIIPAFNAAEYLHEALDSVLQQTYPVMEVLVIDDGSKDDTAGVAERYGPPVRVIRTSNEGAAQARNTGMEAATGELVAFLDSDDIWEPNKLTLQLDRLSSRCRWVYTDTICFGIEETAGWQMSAGGTLPSGDVLVELLEGNFIATSSVLLDTRIGRQAGGFDPRFKIAEDWIFWLRVAKLTHASYVAAPLVRYRMRSASLGSNVEERIRDSRRVIEEGLSMAHLPEAEKRAIRRRALSRSYHYAALLATVGRQQRAARRCSLAAFRYDPSIKSIKQLLKSWLGPELAGRIRRRDSS